jgi:hypothetical protein
MKIPTLLALACAVAIAIPLRMAGADPEGYPSGKPFQAIEADFDSLQEAVDGLSGDLQSLSQTLMVQLTVDTEVCVPFPVQCGSNAAFDNGVPANNGNANPVHLITTVSQGGVPVTGLTLADFQFVQGTVPAGGSALAFCSETDCTVSHFSEVSPGIYRMFLVTFDLSDWDDGVYTGALSVTHPEGGNGFALISLKIPPV